jgi:hypothetical protein
MKALRPKSEKCIFVGYFEDVKSHRLLQLHSNEIIIRKDVKFDENILACEPNSTFVPSSAYKPSSLHYFLSLQVLHHFLGLQVLQTKEGIFISQYKYVCDLPRPFHMEDNKPTTSPFQFGVKLVATFTSPKVDVTLYRQLVGIPLYLTDTCHDISFVVGVVA